MLIIKLLSFAHLVQPFVGFAEAWIEGEWFNSRIRVEVAKNRKVTPKQLILNRHDKMITWGVELLGGLLTDWDPFLHCWELRWLCRSGLWCCWRTSSSPPHPPPHSNPRRQCGKPWILKIEPDDNVVFLRTTWPIWIMSELVEFLEAVLDVRSTWRISHFPLNTFAFKV